MHLFGTSSLRPDFISLRAISVRLQPLIPSAVLIPSAWPERARRVTLVEADLYRTRGKTRAALAVARVLDAREREADVLAVIGALGNEVLVGRERHVHDRARERRRVGRVDVAPRPGPRARRERRRLVNLHTRSCERLS